MSQPKPVAKKAVAKNPWKERFRFFFSTLISNDACIEGRKKPWYAPALLALVAAAIATTPTMNAYLSQSGGSLLDSPLYGLDNALVDFTEKMADENVNLQVQNGVLTASSEGNDFSVLHEAGNSYYGYFYDYTEVKAVTSSSDSSSSDGVTSVVTITERRCDLVVYYYPGEGLSSFITTILSTPANDPNNSWETVSAYSTNALFLGDESFCFIKKPSGTSSYAAERFYKWDAASIQGFRLADLASKTTHGVSYSSARGTAGYQTEVLDAWREMLTDAWDSTRIVNGWTWTGITFAIYVGLTLVLGFSVWLMTRGKNNPFSIYTFLDCQKIAYWASFAPALLTLLGFIPLFQSGWSLLLYIFLFGIRIMWMSMRSLRPQFAS
jgi:hypothetical protein